MVRIVESVGIAAPLARVWRTFTDLTCWTGWNSVLTGIEAGGKPCIDGPGAFRCCIRPFGLPVLFEAVVREVEPMRKVVWTGERLGLKGWHEFLFEGAGTGSRVLSRETLTGLPVVFGGLLFPVGRFRRMTLTFLEDLKQEAERQAEGP